MTNLPPAGVQRYRLDGYWQYMSITPQGDGDWVRHSDHAAALAAKEGEIERLKEAAASNAEVHQACLGTEKCAIAEMEKALADRDRLAAENARLREELSLALQNGDTLRASVDGCAATIQRSDAAFAALRARLSALTASEKGVREALAVVVGALHRLDAIYAAEQEPRDDGSLPRPSWLASVLAQHPAPQPETKGGGES